MEWVLIGLITVAVAVNIGSFIVLAQFKQQRAQMQQDAESAQHSMEQFIANVEKENDELYRELAGYIKGKEKKLEDRIRLLEEKMGSENPATVAADTEPSVETGTGENPALSVEPPVTGTKKERITQLHKQGFSPKQIARVLQVEHGEVELMINMFNKKQSYSKVK
ncbi:DUF6115 domain-containing protein [Planococcus salinus]|uniref:Uncharacterized protein n=1 Tax=Planococcus salinus TaxID=1848460 RepID=A0A3M8P500_9BACL|nr:hypothetical protein [Planococcus salinus]RNF38739.1 hypothetical protein EEX84_12965 [Planococcus salinus]